MADNRAYKKWANRNNNSGTPVYYMTEHDVFINHNRPMIAIEIKKNGQWIKYNSRNYTGLFDTLLEMAGSDAQELFTYRTYGKTIYRYVTNETLIKLVNMAMEHNRDTIRPYYPASENATENDFIESRVFSAPQLPFDTIRIGNNTYCNGTHHGLFNALIKLGGDMAQRVIVTKRNNIHTCRYINRDDFIKLIYSLTQKFPDIISVKNMAAIKIPSHMIRQREIFSAPGNPWRQISFTQNGKSERYNKQSYLGLYDRMCAMLPAEYANMFQTFITNRVTATCISTIDFVKAIEKLREMYPDIVTTKQKQTEYTNTKPHKKTNIRPKTLKKVYPVIPTANPDDLGRGDIFAGPNHPYASLIIQNIKYNYLNFHDVFKHLTELSDPEHQKLFKIKRRGQRMGTYISRLDLENVIRSINKQNPGTICVQTRNNFQPNKNDFTEYGVFFRPNHPFSRIDINGHSYSGNNAAYHGLFHALADVAGVKYSQVIRKKHDQNGIYYMNINDINALIAKTNEKNPGTIKVFENKITTANINNTVSQRNIFYGPTCQFKKIILTDKNGQRTYTFDKHAGLFQDLANMANVNLDEITWHQLYGPHYSIQMTRDNFNKLIEKVRKIHQNAIVTIPIERTR